MEIFMIIALAILLLGVGYLAYQQASSSGLLGT
jgi:hypothetical protein